MSELKFDYLPEQPITDLEKLSAVLSPVGSDIARFVKKNGRLTTTEQVQIDYFPDGPEVNFHQVYETSLSSGQTVFNLIFDPDYRIIVINQLNTQNKAIYSLLLPTQGEISNYLNDNVPQIAYFDRISKPVRIYDPANTDQTRSFYQKAYDLLSQVQNAAKVL